MSTERPRDIPVAWHEDCLRRQPAGEVWLGERIDGTEVPERQPRRNGP